MSLKARKCFLLKTFFTVLNYNPILLFLLNIKHTNIHWKYLSFMGHSFNNCWLSVRYYFSCYLEVAYIGKANKSSM